jgi:fused signal recognition particle receptor
MFEKLKSGFKGLVNKVTTTELKAENLSPILSDFKMSLAENDVAFPVADKICDELELRLAGVQVKRLDDRKKMVEENLRHVLLDVMLTKQRIDLLEMADEKRKKKEPFTLMFVGINGTGKTTTIAKVAQFLRNKSFSVLLAAADTYRAGSIEQLEEHGKRLGMRVMTQLVMRKHMEPTLF